MYIISRLRLDRATPVVDNDPETLVRVIAITKGYINGYWQFANEKKTSFLRETPFHLPLATFNLLTQDGSLNDYYTHEIDSNLPWEPTIRKILEMHSKMNFYHHSFITTINNHIRVASSAIMSGKASPLDSIQEEKDVQTKPRARFQ